MKKILSSALLGVAAVGTASSTVFLGLAIAGAIKFWNQARKQEEQASRLADDELPPVSVLKPLHGDEAQLELNLESFFEQDYPADFEVLFAVDHEDDAALPAARAVAARYPYIPSQIVVNGEPPWPNPPAYSFHRMAQVAKHDVLVTSDSDVVVETDYLRGVVGPMLARNVGSVTCVYRGVNAGGFWSLMDAVGMSVEMTAGVMVANLLEGIKFGLGPTIVVGRDALNAIGGYAAVGDHFSNDFAVGNKIADAGYGVVLSSYVIGHVVPPMTFRKMWQRQLRWATGTKHSRQKGHLGTGLVFAVPYGIIGLVGALLARKTRLGIGLLVWSITNRMIESLVVGWGVTRDPECLRRPWLYPIRDVLGFAVWVASYLHRNMRWRDGQFELIKGGKILMRDRYGRIVRMQETA